MAMNWRRSLPRERHLERQCGRIRGIAAPARTFRSGERDFTRRRFARPAIPTKVGFDAASFPNAVAFVDRLPDRWASFPKCQVHASVVSGALAWIGDHVKREQLPRELVAYADPATCDEWIPECVGLTFLMMMFDQLGEERGVAWFYDDSSRLFDRPILRHVMRVMSPTLLVMGAAHRWSMLHRGTSLVVTPVKRADDRAGARARLVFPADLYPRLFLLGIAASFRAALDGARGREVRSELVDVQADEANYEVSWQR